MPRTCPALPRMTTTTHAITSTKQVRTAVARVDSTAVDAHLREDARQRGEHRGAHGVPSPRATGHAVVLLATLEHHERSREDAHAADELDGETLRLAEEHDGEKHREHRGALVDGDHLVDVTLGERTEVADPAGSRGEAREREEEQRARTDGPPPVPPTPPPPPSARRRRAPRWCESPLPRRDPCGGCRTSREST